MGPETGFVLPKSKRDREAELHELLPSTGRGSGGSLKGSAMRGSRASCLLNTCWKLVILAAFTLFLGLLPAVAQKAQGNDTSTPKYDVHTETTVKGTVEEVKLPAKGNEIAHLMVKSGSGIVDVYLCPKSFLDDMGLSFSKGEEVAVTGSKITQDNADMVLARAVEKGNDNVTLRDAKGTPVWSWQHK